MDDNRVKKVLAYIKACPARSSKEIYEGIQWDENASYATVKRDLSKLVAEGAIYSQGRGKASRFITSPLFSPVELEVYFQNDVDNREVQEGYNFSLLADILPPVSLFNQEEAVQLNALQQQFLNNVSGLSESIYRKEMERMAIDLSWKSSQIEGNTYSLLETERLLKEKETASGKTKEEATMLLNHKEALDFILAYPDYLVPLSIAKIEDIHSILTKELNVERNIRTRRVGITGTNYRPLDNEFQIRDELGNLCALANGKENVFEKALLSLVMLSYIQPFNDGNKRTARIVCNAILLANQHCPISFRTVSSLDYKKAMLLFYEQNNLSPFKKIFIDQFKFAVNTYF
jgi:Fic family protein